MAQNQSEEIDEYLKNQYLQNRNLPQPWYTLCILSYTILVAFAVAGNSLVLIAMARSKELRKSARNILIGLLATSDLLLSCTMPLTAIDALTKYWPFGKETLNLCRTVKTSSAVAVYLSSMTLIAIALDRYHCIVQSSKRQMSVAEAGLIAPVLLVISMLMATPIFFHTRLHEPFEDNEDDDDAWSHVVYCVEDWSYGEESDPKHRIYYSIFSMAMQYVIPFVSMASIYLRIFYYLKTYRIVRPEKPEDKQKARRTNVMLFSISMVFCVAWLPLNLIGILLDAETDLFGDDTELMILTFIACHLIGMSSACINPVLYGYLNETFRTEFIEICSPLNRICPKFMEKPEHNEDMEEVQPLELKVLDDTKQLKVEQKLIPRRPEDDLSRVIIISNADLVTVHPP